MVFSDPVGGGPGKLTAAALLRHDAVLGGGDKEGGLEEDDVSLKMTNKTFDTFASDWSQCTNVAFCRLQETHHPVQVLGPGQMCLPLL